MKRYDVVIVGGGMVGLTTALAIRKQTTLSVAIIDSQPLNPLNDNPHLRVSAINGASRNVFINLGVWSGMCKQRMQAYQKMHVWDKDGFGHIDFDFADVSSRGRAAHTLNVNSDNGENSVNEPTENALGHIIENDVIRNALWHKAQADQGIDIIADTLTSLGVGAAEVFLSFAEQTPITAKLVIGADGANSWVRKQLDIAMTFRDYDHHAVVASVHCQQGHQNTAWQVFLNSGPLAFLPVYQADTCSIVWSLPPDEALRVKNLSATEFNKEISAASDGKLGCITLQSERVSFPLTMRLAHDFVQDRVVLIGDAAHTIHPLAGQGVNLGLIDAAAIAQTLEQICQQQGALNDSKALNQFARWRKSDASDMIVAMESIKQGFAVQQVIPKFVRGIGMSLLNNVNPVKKLLIKQALGQRGDLPTLAQQQDPLD